VYVNQDYAQPTAHMRRYSLRMDGFAWLFAMLISAIGFLVVLYARYYMSPEDPVPRFFSFLLAFMGAMLGIAMSGNLILLVIFWEMTSIFSFLLIGYWHHNASARDGARMALTVTGIGGLALLAVADAQGADLVQDVLVEGQGAGAANPVTNEAHPTAQESHGALSSSGSTSAGYRARNRRPTWNRPDGSPSCTPCRAANCPSGRPAHAGENCWTGELSRPRGLCQACNSCPGAFQ